MNTKWLFLLAAGLVLPGGAALADEDLFRSKNCLACHRIDRNTLGPSLKSIAARYADQTGVEARLAERIRAGGVGVWGQVPMPPQPQVAEGEAATLARWILGLK